MLLSSNPITDKCDRLTSAFDTSLAPPKNDLLTRKAISSNPILQHTRSDDIDLKFKLRPTLLPKRFLERWNEDNFKNSNKFSEHDNRNVIQDYGEYFGQGYGKKLIETNFYRTDPSHLSHEPVDPQNYITTHKYHFVGAQIKDITENHRRFPRSYRIKHNSAIESTLNDKPMDITSHVLKQLKEKFSHSAPNYDKYSKMKTNPWKYSYKNDFNVYPNIKLQQIRKSCIDLSKY